MKVLLTCTTVDDAHRDESDNSHYPLGLAYLHAAVEKTQRHQINTQFLNNVTWDVCLEKLKEEIAVSNPDVVGISLMTHSRVSAFKLIEYLYTEHPDTQIVVGGIHVSVTYQQLLEKYDGVIAVIGEGENTFIDLLDALEEGRDLKSVHGIASKDSNGIYTTPARELIEDLDELDFPTHSLFFHEGRTVAGMITSRGCPFKCNFCVLDSISRRKVRYRSAKNVVDELEHLIKTHPKIDVIWFHDDAFMLNKKRTLEICEEIVKRGISTALVCSARFKPLSKEVLQAMERAGFKHILFGLESGATNVMKQMGKGLTKDTVRNAVALVRETNIKMTAFLIVGLPGESWETIRETGEFVQELQEVNYFYYDDVGLAAIYPGTELFEIAKREGMEVSGYGPIDENIWMSDIEVPLYTVVNTQQQLEEMKEDLRNTISMNRLSQPIPFLRQRKLLPEMLRYNWRFGDNQLLMRYTTGILNSDPNLVNGIIRSFFTEDQKPIRRHILHIIEKQILQNILRMLPPDEGEDYLRQYHKQVRQDNE